MRGWQLVRDAYYDGGFSGGNLARPALKRLMEDVAAKAIDTVVVYKVDRLTRSLADFAKIVEQFDKQGISFVSVTQQFNTTTSMGRLTLNVLLSFAQFEREVTGERILELLRLLMISRPMLAEVALHLPEIQIDSAILLPVLRSNEYPKRYKLPQNPAWDTRPTLARVRGELAKHPVRDESASSEG